MFDAGFRDYDEQGNSGCWFAFRRPRINHPIASPDFDASLGRITSQIEALVAIELG